MIKLLNEQKEVVCTYLIEKPVANAQTFIAHASCSDMPNAQVTGSMELKREEGKLPLIIHIE